MVKVVRVPRITSSSPDMGLSGGGTTITLTGEGFTQGSDVTIGAANWVNLNNVVISPDGKQLTGVTPAPGSLSLGLLQAVRIFPASSASPHDMTIFSQILGFKYQTGLFLATYEPVKTVLANTPFTAYTPTQAFGGSGTYIFSLYQNGVPASLPAGLSLNTTTGEISGYPTTVNALTSYTMRAQDANLAQYTTNTFNLAVVPPLSARVAVPAVQATQSYALTQTPVVSVGGVPRMTYALYDASNATAASLPAGLSFDTSTGQITGTPTVSQTATVYTVRIQDATGATASETFSLLVNPSLQTVRVVASSVFGRNVTITSFTPVTASGGTGTLAFAVRNASNTASASLPVGLSVNTATGEISGTPTVTTALTTYTMQVTDANGATSVRTFTLTVTASTDASLSALSVSSGSLVPTFAGSTTAYAVNVGYAVSSITLTPTVNQTSATVTVAGASVVSGSASGGVALNVGSNSIAVVVTAQDGTTTRTYTVTVTRAASIDATLSALTLSSGALSPAFASGTVTYTASVANSVSSLTVTPTVTQANATVKVNGVTVASVPTIY